jgi:DNA-binding transcriptional MerR regulator
MTPLLTPQQAADFLKVSPRTLRYWRSIGDGPAFLKLGSALYRYSLDSLTAYVDSRKVDPSQ